MGGGVQKVGQAIGVDKKPSAPAPAPAPAARAAEPTPGVERATQDQELAGSRMRGARRRGRALLSDARLMGELGVETLGGGTNL